MHPTLGSWPYFHANSWSDSRLDVSSSRWLLLYVLRNFPDKPTSRRHIQISSSAMLFRVDMFLVFRSALKYPFWRWINQLKPTDLHFCSCQPRKTPTHVFLTIAWCVVKERLCVIIHRLGIHLDGRRSLNSILRSAARAYISFIYDI